MNWERTAWLKSFAGGLLRRNTAIRPAPSVDSMTDAIIRGNGGQVGVDALQFVKITYVVIGCHHIRQIVDMR